MSEIQKSIEEKDKGNKALQEKDYPKALEHYTNAIQLDPKNHIFYSNRSSVYALLEKYDEALEDANKTLELDPKFVRGYSRKGTALFFLKRYKEAHEVFSEGLKLEPNNENFRQEQGRSQTFMLAEPFLRDNVWDKLKESKETVGFLNQPDFVQRINQIRTNPIIFNQFLQMDQRILQAFVTLSGITVQNNPPVDTEEQPQQSKTQQQPPKEKATIQDDEDEDKKDIEEELRKREREEKRRKEREQREKEEKEKENESRKEVNEEEMKLFNEAQELKKKGNDHYVKKEFESAIEYYDKASQLYPKDILFLTNKAACLVEMKKYEESVKVCDEAIKIGEEMQASYESIAKAFERKGNALVKLENYEEAIIAYEKSLTNNRTQSVIKVLRTTREKNEKKKKLDYINPELSEKEKELGNECFKTQRFPEAIKHYSEAILRNPKNHVLYTNRSIAYLKLGEYPHALADSEKSVELDPTYAKGWLRKGKAHHCLKQYHKAIESYDNGLKHDPNNQEIQQGIVETTKAIQIQNYEGVTEEQRNRAMQDPEIQNILKDPSVQKVLQAFQTNPQEGNRLLNLNMQIKSKIEKLVQAGIISMR
eukprot:TRINITY_DN15088_c0_g1_i1.p1 TRINITY_DN15088_c0_g1~~TRINITY_DN15088_c0_g1_i1.p1  ORF type:complete len:594 (-),score=234.40 TRINITY_DN15088_c0_g1_i1:2029-3810(-)